jgi:hypothetical protein
VQGADISTLVRSASRPLVDAALARTKFGTKATGVTVVLLIALIGANVLNLAADLMAIGQCERRTWRGTTPWRSTAEARRAHAASSATAASTSSWAWPSR